MQAALEELESLHGIRPVDGLQIVGSDRAATVPFDPGIPLLLLPAHDRGQPDVRRRPDDVIPDGDQAVFAPRILPGRHAHGPGLADILRALYPADHPVVGLDGAPDATAGSVDDAALLGGTYLVPALHGEHAMASPHGLPWLVARLRAPGGCPWDAEQTHLSLRKFLLEETYEVYDALESGSPPTLAEELGDLLLQVILHAHYGAEAGVFDLTDVYRGIVAKIVRRHPHVFGDVEARTAEEVIRNWETIKAGERAALPDGGPARDPSMPAAFSGLSKSLPALVYASEMQERAAGLGYHWPDVEGVIDKIEEEAVELLGATDPAARHEEFGDLLFVVVNLGRKLDVDPEAALRNASRKFAARFARVERIAAERGLELRALGLDALDDLWEAAKAEERRVGEV